VKDEAKKELSPSIQSRNGTGNNGGGINSNILEASRTDGLSGSPSKILALGQSNGTFQNNNSLEGGHSNQKQRDSRHL